MFPMVLPPELPKVLPLEVRREVPMQVHYMADGRIIVIPAGQPIPPLTPIPQCMPSS